VVVATVRMTPQAAHLPKVAQLPRLLLHLLQLLAVASSAPMCRISVSRAPSPC